MKHILTSVFAAMIWLASSCTAAAPVIRTSDQGMHRIAVPGGQLIAVKGVYQDALKYKRSLSFYFQTTNDSEWDHVPIADSENEYTLQWFHGSSGEDTLADAVIVRGTRGVFLIIVDAIPSKKAFTVERYVFGEARDAHPYGPSRLFVRQSVKTVAARASDTVETLLDKEAASIK